tara:strand:- start:179 stop:409 length:231 start_codon:yes stop_codon:yes gene_type:complete
MNKRSKYYKYNIKVSKETREEGYAVYVHYYTPHYSIDMRDYMLHCSTTIVKSFKDFIRLIRSVYKHLDSIELLNVK